MSEEGRIPLSLEGIERALARTKEGHRREYVDALRKRVAAYEKKYAMPSSILRASLSSRQLQESLDMVKWLHAYDSLVSLEDGTEREPRMANARRASPPAKARSRR